MVRRFAIFGSGPTCERGPRTQARKVQSSYVRRMLRTGRIKVRSKDRIKVSSKVIKRTINPADDEGEEDEEEEAAKGAVPDLLHRPRERKRHRRNEEEEENEEEENDGVFD